MFAEPLSVTYDGGVKTMARVAGALRPGTSRLVGTSTFSTAGDEFKVYMTEYSMGGGMRRFEVSLERTEQDTDGDPFNGAWRPLPNRVGLVFEVNDLKYNSTTDLPLLQSAIVALVDGPFRARLIGGEK